MCHIITRGNYKCFLVSELYIYIIYTSFNSLHVDHTDEKVPQEVKEKIQSLVKSFNDLRILTYRHLESLKVNPDELRVIVCNPERRWEGDDHKNV